jgi:hypothetical protein
MFYPVIPCSGKAYFVMAMLDGTGSVDDCLRQVMKIPGWTCERGQLAKLSVMGIGPRSWHKCYRKPGAADNFFALATG